MATKRYISKIPWDIIEDLSPRRHAFSNTEAFIYLSTHVNYGDEENDIRGVVCKKGQMITSSRELASAFGWPETNVRRFLLMLVKKGYIILMSAANFTKITMLAVSEKAVVEEAQQECGALSGAVCGAVSGAPNTDVNQILTEIGDALSGALSGAESGDHTYYNNNIYINNISCICQKYEPELIFEAWWTLYDNKKSRKTSRAKWMRLKADIWAKAILHTIAYVKATPEKEYRKHPDTYLNGECWNDEITMPQTKNVPKKELSLRERHEAFMQWLFKMVHGDENAIITFHVSLDDFIEMLSSCNDDAKVMANIVCELLRGRITSEEGLIGVFRKRMENGL